MIRAIIADDEPAAGIVIRHLVQKSKLPIEIIGVATDGQKALDMIRAKKPELVFLDIQMPRMNGFEIIQAEPHRKYIIVTAYESFQYAQQALRMGAKDTPEARRIRYILLFSWTGHRLEIYSE